MVPGTGVNRDGEAPSPYGAHSFDELTERLRSLRVWAGLSYRELHRRVVRARRCRGVAELPVYDTVYRCLQPGRNRLDVELVVEIAQVLLADEALAAEWRQAYQAITGGAEGTDAGVVSVADRLPDDTADFTGRAAELAEIIDAGHSGAPVVAIDGMAGVGKTRLAVHAAHRLLHHGHDPDRQLWVNLRGHDPDRPPADPAAVLDALLRRLGVPGSQVHGMDLTTRTARYRQLIADRPTLVVLDNAATADQVRPLLPDAPGSLVLVTSRRQLAGLPVGRQVSLGVFSPAESLDLLRRGAGRDRIDADRHTAARIAELVGQLPLAVALVASRIGATPGWTLADHLERLTERRASLLLDDGIEVALALSYDDLAAADRRMLRLLALHPGRDCDAAAAAALAGVELAAAQRQLTNLLTSNLVQQRAAGRFELHDLIGVFAASRARDDEPPRARRTALTRLFDHYLHAATCAMDSYAPHERHRRPRVPNPGTPQPTFADRESAAEWLESERANLLAIAGHCADHGWPQYTSDLSSTLFRYLEVTAHLRDAEILHTLAARVTHGGRRARALTHVAQMYIYRGRHLDAADHLQQAVPIFREADDRLNEARTLNNLGNAYLHLGRYLEAVDCYQQCVALTREFGELTGEGRALNNLGATLMQLGHHTEALDAHRRALDVLRSAGDRSCEGRALHSIGEVYLRLGRHREALDHTEQCLAVAHEIGHRFGVAAALTQLGAVHSATGHHELAIDHHQQARTIAKETGIHEVEVLALNGIGVALRHQGRPAEAVEHHQRALDIAIDGDYRYEQALAHDGIALARLAMGDTAATRIHWQHALTLHTSMGTPEADEVADRLQALVETGAASGERASGG